MLSIRSFRWLGRPDASTTAALEPIVVVARIVICPLEEISVIPHEYKSVSISPRSVLLAATPKDSTSVGS